jgi:hypothetical protein
MLESAGFLFLLFVANTRGLSVFSGAFYTSGATFINSFVEAAKAGS